MGITQVNEIIEGQVPTSFPAKVLAVLYQRFKAFKGAKENGLVIIATELIPDNGKRLEAIVKNLAQYNQLEPAFTEWLVAANIFCNSLVDRIVPGRPDVENLDKITQELGYTDGLLIMTEPYRLWAIEGDERVKAKLEFANVNEGVIIAENIEIYRELKVRLLNGTHTLTAAIAFLMQMDTVNNAMKNPELRSFMQKVMNEEISKAIPYPVTGAQAKAFSDAVIDRFKNPYIEHLWYNITFQYTMKMKIRVLPLLATYYARYQHIPEYMCLGVAAYLRFMQVAKTEEGKFYGNYNGNQYLINDEHAAYFRDKPDVYTLLSDQQFWGVNFSTLGDFIHQVDEKYREIENDGIIKVLLNLLAAKTDRI
ncbi:Altronate oxidoreductase [compost metagenome]